MFFKEILFLFLSSIVLIVKCHQSNDHLLNISLGLVNTRTVIACGSSIEIYSTFDPVQIMACPYVSIPKENIQLIDMKIFMEDNDKMKINLTSPFISPPKLRIKLSNNTLVRSSNTTGINTYYLSFSSELTCRFTVRNNFSICFYYPSSTDFLHIEHYYDKMININLILPIQTRHRFLIFFIVIGLLTLIVCLFAIYFLCTSPLSLNRMIELDHILDPQLVKATELKLGPEPV